MKEDTKVQEEAVVELEGRAQEMNKELIPLLGKYELGLGASAFVNPNGTIGARPIYFDARKKAEEKQPENDRGAVEPAAAEPAEAKVTEG